MAAKNTADIGFEKQINGHVGIVKSVSGNTYVTIDGNSKDQVRTTNRTVGSPKASFL